MLKISRLKIKIGLTGLMILGVLILVLMPIQQVKAGWLEENIAKLTKMLPIPGSIIYDNNGSLFFGTIFKACPYKEEIEDCTDPNCIRADKCNSNGDCKNITCETGTKFCNKSGDKDTRNNNEGICACASCEDKKYALGWPADANPNCTFIENGVNKTMCPIIKESDKCLKKANGKCQRCENIFNQFQDTWRITDKNGKTKDYFQTAVLDDQTGRFKVPTPVLPSECELGMVETDPNATPTSKTQAERLSKARSCLSLEQLQREAAQAVFQAKLLYNATDPFSTCNFLGTCKSACFLKFGTIAYTVTMADVLKTVVPGGALLWAQKIYKLVKIFQKIKSAVDTAKGLYKAVDTLVNNVWGLIKQASNLYLSLDNIGLKWSDALGPLASSAIQGEDRGPVAAWGGLMKIIDDFASGLAGFSVAKSEAISTIDVIEQNMRGNIKGKIMEAPELSFLFAKDNANKKALNQMMNNYFKALTSMNTIFDDVITNILTVPSRQYQKQECGADVPSMDLRDRCISCYSCIQNPNPKLTDLFSFPEIFTGPSTDAKRCGNLFRRFPYFCPLPSSGTGRDVRDGWNQVCDPLFKPNQDFIAETNEGFFGWVNGLFENKEEKNIDKRFNRFFTVTDKYLGSPTVIDIASLNNGGKTLVLYRHPGELDPDYESQVTVSKVPLDYQNTPAVDEVFCSIPSRVAPRVLVDGDTENWFKIYQVASAKLLRLKDYLSTAGVLIENVNADPNDAGQYIGAISKIFNGTLDDQKYPDVLKWKTALGLIGDIKTDLGKLSTNDKNLRDNFESRCKTKIKDCAKYPCTVEEQKCSGTAYWQEYVWYDGRVITKGDPIPKDSCLVNITTINNAKKNGYQVDLMGVDWEARIENLILAVDNLNLMFQGLAYPGCTLAPCLSPTSSAILFEISGASAVVESKTDAFIKTVGDSSRCPTGALGKCNTFCGSTAFTKYKDRTACRDACKEFGTAGSARDACRQNCTDNCTTSKNSCSTSQCKDACKAGNSACSSGGVLASYKIQENLDSFVGNLTKIGNRLKEIQETWSTTSPGSPTADERPNFELDVAETYTWQVKRMIELSREINEKLLPDATKAWSNLQDAYNRLNSSGSVSQASLEAWKGIFVGDSITNKIDVLQKIEKLLGKKYVCDENDLGFLPQIKCFEEKKIQKNFDQLYNFFTKASVLEDALYFLTSPATSSVKRLVLGLEPMIDMAKDDGSGAKTVDEYFSSMTENPLSYIEKSFTKINQTQERVRQWFEFSMGGIKDFFHDAYQEPEKLVGTQSANLTRLVFGENDLRSACDSLKVVLDQNPQDFKAACLADYASLTSEGDLANQKETEKSCGQFGILMGALNNECDKISSTWSSYCKDQACGDNEDCVKYCRDKVGDPGINGTGRCYNLKDQIKAICNDKYQAGCVGGVLPNFLLQDSKALNEAQTAALNEAQTAQREKLIEVCSTQLTDIKSNLGKVMKAFSIITGIQAFTALAQPDISFSLKKGVKFNGFDGPKDLQQDTKKAVEAAYDLRDTILGLSKQLRDAVKSKDAPDMKKESGFSFDAPTCETKPATSYSVVTGVTDVGVKGGSVCPDAGAHFKLIEAHFSQVRKYLFDIDLERKNMARLELGPLGLDILKKAPTVFPLVDSVYKKAYSIKQQTQLLWAMGTAVDFAQQQCNCGQSFCKLCLYEKKKDPNCPDGNPDKPCEMVCWAPVCVTGVPLTPDPITQPFCYVTYIMREPLKSMAERLENSLLGK